MKNLSIKIWQFIDENLSKFVLFDCSSNGIMFGEHNKIKKLLYFSPGMQFSLCKQLSTSWTDMILKILT